MEALSLLHFIMRWLLVLVGAGAWLWLVAMLLALAGWTLWSAHQLVARARRSIGSSRRHRRALAARKPRSPAMTPIPR